MNTNNETPSKMTCTECLSAQVHIQIKICSKCRAVIEKNKLISALKTYTKNQLYGILINMSSDNWMTKKERIEMKKTEMIEHVVRECEDPENDSVPDWWDGIIAKDDWVWTR